MGVEQNEKPKKRYQVLGSDTSMQVTGLPPDQASADVFARVGRDQCPQGLSYLGYACVFVYGTTSENPLTPPGAAFLTRVNLGQSTEAVAQVALQELGARVYANYRGEKKSIDPNYRVEL